MRAWIAGKERRIIRWQHEHVLEAVQKRLDENPQAMRQRRKTVEVTPKSIRIRKKLLKAHERKKAARAA